MPAVPRIRQYCPDKFLAQIHDRYLVDNFQILCTLRDVNSMLDVFHSDLLPSSRPILTPCKLIINADHNTVGGSHWLVIRLTPRSSSAYCFDSYDIVPLVPVIQNFLKRHYTTWEYKKRYLRGPTSEFCGQCCFLFALYMGRGYTPQQFITLFAGRSNADRQVTQFFAPEFGAPCRVAAGVNAAAAAYNRLVLSKIPSFLV